MIISISIAIFIAGIFYWYEWRPSQIRKECSWVEVIKPAQEVVTKEEAEKNKQEYEECLKQEEEKEVTNKNIFLTSFCETINKNTVEREYIPQEVYYRKASNAGYEFCLNVNGLK